LHHFIQKFAPKVFRKYELTMQVYSFTGIIKYHPKNGFVFLSLHTSEKKFN